ncbi:MAG TPA: TonB-dependent receptor plug domain-containing protein, partial [Accumulibacter sp.]|nr:TonB-dependent receptor plug domain-containing protein [Accumulibacter sp.]
MHRSIKSSTCHLVRHWQANVLLTMLTLVLGSGNALAAVDDLTALSLEQLMDVSVSSASRFEQKVSKIASSVTVISREEIQQHGWRTLAQALRSVPGFYIHYDRNYDYIGARGFARPQDYNSRILLLIDGYRTNDPLYDQAYVGSEQLLDIDLVERIEVVRGPGSSVYGGNAIFGVVNIITRAASEINGFESAAGWASHHSREGRLTYGRRAENGVELLAS